MLAGALVSACAGPARTGSPGVAPRFVAVVGAHDNLRGWGEQAVAACRAWWPQIVAALPDPTLAPPAVVTLQAADLDPHVSAAARGDVVRVNALMLSTYPPDPNDVDVILAELIRMVQRYPEPHSRWLAEGIVSWVRDWRILTEDPDRIFDPSVVDHRTSAPAAAALLASCEGRSPGVVAAVHLALRRGQDGTATLVRRSGAPLDELWRATAASHSGAQPS